MRLPGRLVSRVHATIELLPATRAGHAPIFALSDCNSANGATVNGKDVLPLEGFTALQHGDVIGIAGETEFLCFCCNWAAAASFANGQLANAPLPAVDRAGELPWLLRILCGFKQLTVCPKRSDRESLQQGVAASVAGVTVATLWAVFDPIDCHRRLRALCLLIVNETVETAAICRDGWGNDAVLASLGVLVRAVSLAPALRASAVEAVSVERERGGVTSHLVPDDVRHATVRLLNKAAESSAQS